MENNFIILILFMKKQNLLKSYHSNLKLYKDVYKVGSMISLTNPKSLLLVLKVIGYRIVTMSLLSTKETSRFRMLHNFGVFLIKMVKNHGELYTVKYLKASQLCIQKKLAGQPFSSMREIEPEYNFPRLSKSGLPSVIKLTDRMSICNGSLRIIRLYLSIFSLYRIIKVPFSPKLSTITDNFSGSGIHLDDFNWWLTSNSSIYLTKFSKLNIKDLNITKILPLVKSSPLGSVSYTRLIGAYWSLKKDEILFESVNRYLQVTNSKNIITLFSNIEYLKSKFSIIGLGTNNGHLGSLSFKEEAAGKLRVFAMVDVITQSLFAPLHKVLFDLFKKIPNDFTHNQNKGFLYAQSLSLKYNCSYGFDLSAATDRLPVISQSTILNSLFGNNIGYLWSTILVSRDYFIPENDYSIPSQLLRYSVGQPMGALSSWAMLNLTHHMMIQYLACKLNKVKRGVWYDQYLVLGDDLSLYDADIAKEYQVLCNNLGISINLSKSIISKDLPVLEFAKRTSYFGKDVSPLSFKELLMSNNFFGRLAVTSRLINNKWGKNLFKLLIIGNRRSTDKTIDRLYPMVGFVTQLFQNNIIRLSDVLSLISSREHPTSFFGRDIGWLKPGLISKVIHNYLSNDKFDITILPKEERFHSELNVDTFKSVLIHDIEKYINQIRSTSILKNRVQICYNLITFPDLVSLNRVLSDEGGFFNKSFSDIISSKVLLTPLSMTLFNKVQKIMVNISSFSAIFFTEKNGEYPNLKLLHQGLDMDLTNDMVSTLFLAKYEWSYLNEFKNDKKKFFLSKKFLDLELSELLKHREELIAKLASLKFHNLKDVDLTDSKLDNPLKILDFIKDIHNPKFKVDSPFIKFENQYLDKDAFGEKPRGFTPRFDFSKPRNLLSKNDFYPSTPLSTIIEEEEEE
jgi:hypothetical protein